MRIISGAWRGRRLIAPEGQTTRPTSDRARQALFDMLIHAPWAGTDSLSDAAVLDAFAGSGALGLEALSRGAARADFIENDPAALRALRANIVRCGAGAMCRVLAGDASTARLEPSYHLVFIDPPYRSGLAQRFLDRAGAVVGAETLVVAETAREEPLACNGVLLADRAHGAARLRIWRGA